MSLTIRLRSKEGTSRIAVDPTTAGEDLAQVVRPPPLARCCSSPLRPCSPSPLHVARAGAPRADLTLPNLPRLARAGSQIVDSLEDADPDIDTITLSNAPGSSGQRFALDALYGRTIAELGFKCVGRRRPSPFRPLGSEPSSASASSTAH